LLTTTQASQIADQNRDQDLWPCLTGSGECDHSILTESESTQVGVPNSGAICLPVTQRRIGSTARWGQKPAIIAYSAVEAAKVRAIGARAQSAAVSNRAAAVRHDTADACRGKRGGEHHISTGSSGCKTGTDYCQESLLKAADAKEVAQAGLQRDELA